MTWRRRRTGWRGVRRGAAAVVAVVWLGACSRAVELSPGEALEGRLEQQERAEHRLDLEASTYVRLRVVPRPAESAESEITGGEVTVWVTDPAERPLAEAVGVRDEFGGLLAWIADSAGRYRIAIENTAPLGATAYRIEVEEARPVQAGDRHRSAAENARAEADRLSATADREQVLAALERAYDEWLLAGETDAAVGVLIAAVDYDWEADPEAGLARCEQALELSTAAGLATRQADALNRSGRILIRHRRDCQGALAAYERARGLVDGTGDLERALTIRYNIAVLQRQCAPELAPAAFDEALAAARRAGDPVTEAYLSRDLTVWARQEGDLDRAREHIDRAWRLAQESGDQEVQADVAHELGNVDRRQGRLTEALGAYRVSLDLNETLGNRRRLPEVLLSLGSLALDLRRPEEAWAYDSRALEIATSLGDRGSESGALREMGAVLVRQRDYGQAEEYFRRALAAAEALDPGPTPSRAVATAKFRLGHVLLARGRPEEAVAQFLSALEIQSARGDRIGEVETLRELGTALGRMGDVAAALERLEAARALNDGDPLGELWTLYRRAAVMADVDPAGARRTIEQAIAIGRRLRAGLTLDPLRTGFAEGPRLLYELYVDLLIAAGDEAAAFRASEEGRALALLDLLAEARVELAADQAPELRAEQEALDAGIARLQDELTSAAAAGKGARRQQILRTAIEAAERDWWQAEAAIRKRSPRYGDLRQPAIVGVEEVRSDLPHGRALVQYWLGDDHAYVFVLTRESFDVLPLPPSAEIRDRVAALRKAATTLAPASRYGPPAYELYRVLVAPALASARAGGEPVEELIVVADGPLHLIPFEALVTAAPDPAAQFEDLEYLLRDLSISYAPSATVLASLDGRSGARSVPAAGPRLRFLAFADPRYDRPLALDCAVLAGGSTAPGPGPGDLRARELDDLSGSGREALAIAADYAELARVYQGREASEDRIKTDQAVASAERLHLAVHGVVCEEFPERSGLVFALDGDEREDGILQVREIFGLELAADLVVLSACDTGRGRLVSGEGVVGLARAFFYAGTPSLVVSLWPVSDRSTERLMTSFYRHLDRGHDKAAALKNARLEMIERGGDDAYPLYWAPFVLLGSREVTVATAR